MRARENILCIFIYILEAFYTRRFDVVEFEFLPLGCAVLAVVASRVAFMRRRGLLNARRCGKSFNVVCAQE